jgi:hypothetical protein
MTDLTKPGTFVLGCNYWASHAGTCMWSDWRPDVVAKDLHLLAESGLQILRVFPLWPDFQPISKLGKGWGVTVEFRFGEEPLPDDPAGQAGLSEVMLERFGAFLDLARSEGMRCVVGLITGWMSGRLFVPPALLGREPLTDPLAIQWQLRFVREFIGRFRHHPAICAWDLGNECNCMGSASREQAYVWTATVANAIRAADSSRPIVSGMHSLTPAGAWTMQDQGELTDVLTTHPYPPFTPHCDQDPVNSIRSILHSTAESRFYADIGGKPCLCEELGTLGPMIADESVAADYLRACLFSLWANDCHGALWWCAFDQDQLAHAPYDWVAVERELGLFGSNGRRKAMADTFQAFRGLLKALPFDALPERATEAVCLLTRGQDHWGVAFSSFILAKQAGFDLTFRYAGQPLPEAPVYLLPSLKGMDFLFRRHWLELLDRVARGATLYLSLDDAMPSGFEQLTGLRPVFRERRTGTATVECQDVPGCPSIPCSGAFRHTFVSAGAAVLASEPGGSALLSEHRYGKGRVVFLAVPLEATLANTPGVFHAPGAPAAWPLYRLIAGEALRRRVTQKEHPLLAVTEHVVRETERIVVAINQSPCPMNTDLTLADRWSLAECCHGSAQAKAGGIGLDLPPCNGAVLRVVSAG